MSTKGKDLGVNLKQETQIKHPGNLPGNQECHPLELPSQAEAREYQEVVAGTVQGQVGNWGWSTLG